MSKHESQALRSHYCGLVTIGDGATEDSYDVEIFIRTGENAVVAAWHVVIKDKLSKELRSPHGKAVSVRIADGVQGVGTIIDPRHIRGTGEPPVK